MTLSQAKIFLTEKLAAIYDKREAAIVTDWVLEEITTFTKTERLIRKDETLSIEKEIILQSYCNELLTHRPVQYVLGYSRFMKMKFAVEESVLIPRPETEELVEWIINSVEENEEKNILDIGTGSGIIPVSLKKYLPNSTVSAIDISEKALNIAAKNAAANKSEITFIQADILQNSTIPTFSDFDIIVSNPPYILNSEQKEMNENVLLYEPHIALFVPDNNPILFYEAITVFATQHLKNNGLLFFEINENFGQKIVALLEKHSFINIKLKKDFQGKDRMVKALFKK